MFPPYRRWPVRPISLLLAIFFIHPPCWFVSIAFYPYIPYNLSTGASDAEYIRNGGISMTDAQKYAVDITKDIVIAKLSNSSPSTTNADVGKHIGQMFEAVYNAVFKICSEDNAK